MLTITEPAYITPEGGAVYLEEQPPLRGIRFFDVILFDDDGCEIARFASLGEGSLAKMAATLGWKAT